MSTWRLLIQISVYFINLILTEYGITTSAIKRKWHLQHGQFPCDSIIASQYGISHRVETECKAFSPIVGIGTPPPPHPQASVLFGSGKGDGHTGLRERGWGSSNSNEGTYTVVLHLYLYLVVFSLHHRIHLHAFCKPINKLRYR